jgi:hypothetical protein
MPGKIKLATVYIAAGQPEAEIVKGRLENEGIPAVLRYESLGTIYGITVDGLGQVEIQVPASFVEEARQILGESEKQFIDQAPNKEV